MLPPQGHSGGGLAPWQERRAKEILLGDLQSPRPLSELARTCGLSGRHFLRLFKASTGAPPHRWLLRQRIERAKSLLESTSDPVSDVALACGFADQSHLTRVFRALVGASPAAWRRRH